MLCGWPYTCAYKGGRHVYECIYCVHTYVCLCACVWIVCVTCTILAFMHIWMIQKRWSVTPGIVTPLWNILHQNVTWPIYHIHTKMLHGPSLTPHTKVLHDPYLPPHTRIHMTPGQTGGNIGSVSILSHTEHHHLTSIPVVMCTCTGLHKYNILSFKWQTVPKRIKFSLNWAY